MPFSLHRVLKKIKYSNQTDGEEISLGFDEADVLSWIFSPWRPMGYADATIHPAPCQMGHKYLPKVDPIRVYMLGNVL